MYATAQTVVEKRDQSGTVLWTLPLNVAGMNLQADALMKRSDNCYFLAFTQLSGGIPQPGLAKFSDSGKLLGCDTVNMPGFQVQQTPSLNSSMIYLPVTSGGTAAAIALNPTPLWTSGGTDNNWSTYKNWNGWAPAPGETLTFAATANVANNNDFAPGPCSTERLSTAVPQASSSPATASA